MKPAPSYKKAPLRYVFLSEQDLQHKDSVDDTYFGNVRHRRSRDCFQQ
jgi:hypothetical protein